MNNMVSPTFDEDYFHGIGSNYPKTGYETCMWKRQSRMQGLVDFVIDRCGRGIRWLDIGCAYGLLVKVGFEEGIDIYGIDVSRYAISQGKRIFPEIADRLFVCGCDDVLKIFSRESMDVISLLEVVEHLPHPRESLLVISQTLRKGGIVLLTTPSRFYPDRDVTHISLRPPKYWTRTLTELGFHVRAPYYFFSTPTKSKHKTIRLLDKTKISKEIYILAQRLMESLRCKYQSRFSIQIHAVKR